MVRGSISQMSAYAMSFGRLVASPQLGDAMADVILSIAMFLGTMVCVSFVVWFFDHFGD
jgi:hypothetical protein